MNNLLESLDYIFTCDNIKSLKYNRNIENVLETIFTININNIILSLEEKKIVATKIKSVIKKINHYIFCIGYSFDPNRGRYNLIYRSGIQFLLDELKMWPTDDGYLDQHLTYFFENDSLETFDEAIQQWKENPYYLSIDVIIYPEEEYQPPTNVPTSHTWWYL